MGRGAGGGTITRIPGGRFRAAVYRQYRRFTHICNTRTEANDWITATLAGLSTEAPPLTHTDMVAASAAKALLPPGVSLTDVINYWNEKHALDGHTVEDVADVFMADKERANLRAASMRNLRWQTKRLKDQLGPKPIRTVDREDILAALDALGAKGVGRDDTRRAWKGIWNWAIRNEYTDKNPTSGITAMKQDDAAPGILDPEQVRALFTHAWHHKQAGIRRMVPYLALGFFGGLRTAELERLKWEDIDHAAGHILITGEAAKTRTRRYVTISPTLAAWLATSTRRKGPIVRVQTRARITRLVRLAAAAGIDMPRNALRHSFASYHLALHQDASKTAFELGHTRPDLLYRHYRNLVTKEQAAAYFAIFPDAIRQHPPEKAEQRRTQTVARKG